MKLGVLVDRITVGGVEKTAICEVREMRKLGKDVQLLVLNSGLSDESAFGTDFLDNVEIVYLDRRFPPILRSTRGILGFAFFSFYHLYYPFLLPFFVKDSEWDFVISHGSYTSFSAVFLKHFKRVRFAIFFWDPIRYILNKVYSNRMFPQLVLKVLLRIAGMVDLVLLNEADFVFEGSSEHDAYFRELKSDVVLAVVPPGTDLHVPVTDKESYIVAMTAWKLGKEPEYILEILRRLPGVRLVMIGKWLDQNLLKQFKAKVAEWGLEDRVDVVGFLSEAELPVHLSKSLVLLTTNVEKGFGMPVLEAAACGTTFIVPEGSGVCALFRDGVDGFFSKEKDTGYIVGKLSLLCADKELATRMGYNAFKTVKDQMSWENHAQKVISAVAAGL